MAKKFGFVIFDIINFLPSFIIIALGNASKVNKIYETQVQKSSLLYVKNDKYHFG